MDGNAEALYKQGLNCNLSNSESFQPTRARDLFEQAVALKHPGAMRDLALMLHQGTGGERDVRRAILLLAGAHFECGDPESLEYLIDLLEDEIDSGQSEIANVNLPELKKQLELLRKTSEWSQAQLRLIIRGRP